MLSIFSPLTRSLKQAFRPHALRGVCCFDSALRCVLSTLAHVHRCSHSLHALNASYRTSFIARFNYCSTHSNGTVRILFAATVPRVYRACDPFAVGSPHPLLQAIRTKSIHFTQTGPSQLPIVPHHPFFLVNVSSTCGWLLGL